MITNNEMVQLLLDNGYDSGWAISSDTLILWEHDDEPPTPLTRPEPIEP